MPTSENEAERAERKRREALVGHFFVFAWPLYLNLSGVAFIYFQPSIVTSHPRLTHCIVLLAMGTAGYVLWVRAIAGYDARMTFAALLLHAVSLVLLFAVIYQASGLIENGVVRSVDFVTGLYFSIISWTTVGYGDLAPRPEFRLVAAMEAFLGYVFLAVLAAIASQIESK